MRPRCSVMPGSAGSFIWDTIPTCVCSGRSLGLIEMKKRGFKTILVRDASMASESRESAAEQWFHRAAGHMVEINGGATVFGRRVAGGDRLRDRPTRRLSANRMTIERPTASERHDGPLLSVVAASRNDDHGGDLRARMQHFVNGFVAQC